MGWSSGSEIVGSVARKVSEVLSDEVAKRSIFEELVESARNLDWDTLDECLGIDPVLDDVLAGYFDEDELDFDEEYEEFDEDED